MKREMGQVLPLGVSQDAVGMNFAIEVPRGVECKLLLYKTSDQEASHVLDLHEDASVRGIRCLRLTNIEADITAYSYEVDGETVVDPYVYEVTGRSAWGEESTEPVRGKLITFAHKQGSGMQEIPEHEVIAYRLHVRGFTKHASSKVKAKGTFQGLIEKIPYLKELGVNQVQLLPSFEFEERGIKLNYWGYAPGFYRAPKSAYASSSSASEEFAQMIEAFHANGFEVILDMPFVDSPSIISQIVCLQHYVLCYQVDGFVLNPYTTNLEEVKKDPIIKYVKILAQQDEFQTTMRKFLKVDEGMVKDVMWQLKKVNAEGNLLTYNHMTNHNGFTMADLVTYDGKHNELNGEKNQDGSEYNYCWNCGAEGPTRKKLVVELRKVQMRNAWTLLLLAQGTPCILAGDEFGNSQKGNNNAYCQDNEISWLDWRMLSKQRELHTFVKALIALRKAHPVLHQGQLLQGMDQKACGLPDVSYHGESAWITPEEVASRQLGVLYSGKHLKDSDCYIAYNMHWIEHDYALPTLRQGKKWHQVLDTSTGMIGEEVLLDNQRLVLVPERSVAVFVSK